MMRNEIKSGWALLAAGIWMLGLCPGANAVLTGGRPVDPDRDFGLTLRAGTISDFSGSVQETSRIVQRRAGRSLLDRPESYSFEELGVEGGYPVFGVAMEKWWKYFTFQLGVNYSHMEESSTALRDFYIGVEEVAFRGNNYEYMMIPRGASFDAEIEAFIIEMSLRITPFTVGAESPVSFTPWIHTGVLGMAGMYTFDAGAARGITQSEFPPRDYVIGGKGDGFNGAATPEIGVGGALRLQIGERAGRPVNLALEGTYKMLEYNGKTSDLGISSRNVKKLDLSYRGLDLLAQLELPLENGSDFLVGLRAHIVEIDAYAEADEAQSIEQILARREKFDKDVEVEFTTLTAHIGWRW